MVIEKLTIMKNSEKTKAPGLKRSDNQPIEWKILNGFADYPTTLEEMRNTAKKIALGQAQEQVWLLEHPPLYTTGTSANEIDLLSPARFPVYQAGRGGQFTYHGPGQRVAYVMLDLNMRAKDIRRLVFNLEALIIDCLAAFNISAYRAPGRVGVWVKRPELGEGREDKIAAIGIRVSKWVSFHGISINISPDLSHYEGIIPCGIADQGVTSFEDLGQLVSMAEFDMVLHQNFERLFGPTINT